MTARSLTIIFSTIALGIAASIVGSARPAPPNNDKDRSPCNLALSPDGSIVVTANYTSDTVSLVDLKKGAVIAEAPAGKNPFAVALAPNGQKAVATNWLSNSLTVFKIGPSSISPSNTILIG